MNRKPVYLIFCVLVQLVLQCRTDLPPPEILARMEDKVMSSMTLKDLESMVENNKAVKDVKSRLLSKIPEHMLGGRVVIESDGDAYYESQPSLAPENGSDQKPTERRANQGEDTIERFIVIESADGDEENAKSDTEKLTPEESRAVQHFVEALAEEIATELPSIMKPSRMDFSASENVPSYKPRYDAASENAPSYQRRYDAPSENAPSYKPRYDDASETAPSYKPRFDYDSYSKDSLATKLNGKTYWRDSDHSADPEARSDGKGCTMVVKKFRDPEGHRNAKDGSPVKSVLVTKECVYPDGRGPDAKIPTYETHSRQPLHGFREKPKVRVVSYEKQSLPLYSENIRAPDPPVYSSATESKVHPRDPLKSDYIDKMLEEHFKGFPNFRTTTTAIEELERKLKTELKDVGSQDREVKQPQDSYEDESPSYRPSYDREIPNYKSAPTIKDESPKVYEHHYDYHHSPPKSRDHPSSIAPSSSHNEPPSYREPPHYQHGGHDDSNHHHRNTDSNSSADQGRHPTEDDPTKPKMLKKSFAYYRKDNPKNDPNNHEYAEEYAQGNYRSFSTDYDSDRDGPEKST